MFKKLPADKIVLLTVLVSALGYFVDIFDLLLFSIVRMQSLKDLGVASDDLLSVGIKLINFQMAGLLLGGIAWGIIGDKFGRISVLFGSILLYSTANIANGFVTSVDQYALLRFISGLGLAGELGVGITLASEILPKSLRGLGTTFIATIGVLGASFAAVLADIVDWRTAYIIGGAMGLGLLLLRMQVRESGLYKNLAQSKTSRGNILMLFKNPLLLRRYLAVILIGAPIWTAVGLFITFSPEFAKDFGMLTLPTAGKAVLYCYLGLALGDLFSGLLSQKLKSRRKAVAFFLCLLLSASALFVSFHTQSLNVFYGMCLLLGIGAGYWAMFVQMGAEQFGTNIRATAATSIPNFVRGLTIPITLGFRALIPLWGVTGSGIAIMIGMILLAFAALWSIRETFHTDLDYLEV
jgi:MFS family permease